MQSWKELLKRLNDIIEKYRRDNALSLDEMQFIIGATKECSDTNSLIEYAEHAAHEDIEQLMTDSQTLFDETQRFNSLYNEENDHVLHVTIHRIPMQPPSLLRKEQG